MKVLTIIFMVAITMALFITLTMKNIGNEDEKPPFKETPNELFPLYEENGKQSKKVSRFLADQKITNPRSANQCYHHKDNQICYLEEGSSSNNNNNKTRCCNNKCVDLKNDHQNCGKCKKNCEFTETCCHGKCVELAYDKRHCGGCNNRCGTGLLCIYGMCDYP